MKVRDLKVSVHFNAVDHQTASEKCAPTPFPTSGFSRGRANFCNALFVFEFGGILSPFEFKREETLDNRWTEEGKFGFQSPGKS